MTHQEINERIANLCGLKTTKDGGMCWDEKGNSILYIPDYYHSLDACLQFENIMKGVGAECEVYEDMIAEIVGVDEDFYDGITFREAVKVLYATAAQRCEAFLRMKGQWE